MLISPAYAQGAGGVGGFDIVSLMPLVLIFVVFYFLLIHPQRKKMKEHKAMLGDLRRGDRIVTSGGASRPHLSICPALDLQVTCG